MAFTATIEKEIKVECVSEDKEVLDESDLEKLDVQDDILKAYEKLYWNSEKYEKLYRVAMKKLSNFEIEKEIYPLRLTREIRLLVPLNLRITFLLRKLRS